VRKRKEGERKTTFNVSFLRGSLAKVLVKKEGAVRKRRGALWQGGKIRDVWSLRGGGRLA